jgi:hypothetical protein
MTILALPSTAGTPRQSDRSALLERLGFRGKETILPLTVALSDAQRLVADPQHGAKCSNRQGRRQADDHFEAFVEVVVFAADGDSPAGVEPTMPN